MIVCDDVITASVCEKCGGRFARFSSPWPSWDTRRVSQKIRNPEWCPGCNADILHDAEEDRFWERGEPYLFMGFRLKVTQSPIGDWGQVLLWKKLIHPEAPNLIYSYHSFDRYGCFTLEMACAWLIAHWWEHALDICPCQGGVKDDAKGSTFRHAVMESIMWYHKGLNDPASPYPPLLL